MKYTVTIKAQVNDFEKEQVFKNINKENYKKILEFVKDNFRTNKKKCNVI